MTRKSRNKNITAQKPQKQILASAEIRSGQDTEILAEDLFNEVILDKNRRSAQLVKNKWVLMFDKNNSFLKGLLALLNNSTTLRNVIASKAAFVMGEGFTAVESETTPILKAIRKIVGFLNSEDARLRSLNDELLIVNQAGESLEEVGQKIAFDFCAIGNAYAEIVQTTKEGQPVTYLYHVPAEKVGLQKANERGTVENVGICENWKQFGSDESKISTVPIYPNFTTGAVKRSIIHIKNYAPGFEYYGLPDWISARLWAEIEYRIPKYNITKFKNGFVPSAIIQAFGAMTPEEAKHMINGIDRTFTDTGKNSKIFMQVLRDEKHKINVERLEDNSEGNYLELSKLASQAIVTANRWTMSLAGFATSGKLGTNQQIRDEIEFVTNTVIKPIRRQLLQKVFNVYLKELSKTKGGDYNNIKLDIANLTPVSLASNIDVNSVLLNNEKRNELGYDNLTEESAQQLQDEQNNN